MKQFFHFLQYNNTIPIAVAVIFVGTGSAFAATNPEVFVSSAQQVQSPDNTYILNSDIQNWNFQMNITDVRESEDQYFVTFEYTTIASADYVWQEKYVVDTLKISKKELVGRDLGLFVAKQLSEIAAQEKEYLVLVQEQERLKGQSVKVVVTEYSGLVGKFLDEKRENFPGYRPVVEEKIVKEEKKVVETPNDVSHETELGTSPVQHLLTQSDVEAFIEARVKELLAKQSMGSTVEETETETETETREPTSGADNQDPNEPVDTENEDTYTENNSEETPAPEEPVTEENEADPSTEAESETAEEVPAEEEPTEPEPTPDETASNAESGA